MIRSLRSLGTTILLTTHYLDEAQQLADRVAVLRDGDHRATGHAGRADRRLADDGDPLPARRRARRRRDERPDASAQRADGRGARRTAASSSSSRCGARRSRTSTSSSWATTRRPANEHAAPPAPVRAEGLLAEPRGSGLHLHLPAAALRTARLGVRRRHRRRAGGGRPARRASSATAPPTPRSAGSRSSLVGRREAGILKRLRATPLPPAVYLAAVLLSTLVTFALQSVALLALGGLAFDASMPANWLGFAGAIVLGVACVRRARAGGRVAHPLGGGRLGRRQRRDPARWRSSPARSGRRATSRRSCRRSPTCSRSPTSSTSSTASTCDGDSFFADPTALAIVLAWGVAGVVVALRRFGWMPRER